MKRLYKIFLLLALVLGVNSTLHAQHVISATGGYGFGSVRLYPSYETLPVTNCISSGLSWRYYSQERYWGGFGIDLEYVERGFSVAPNGSFTEEGVELEYYTRDINSLMIPIVWQPHIYTPNHKMRIFIEAAAAFSCDLSSTYDNEVAYNLGKDDWQGEYSYKLSRDNRFGFGLAFGGGFSVLMRGGWELLVRGRYYFGYSDVVRNYNSYVNNYNDGSENPFWSTPQRSQLDSFSLSLGLSFRLGSGEGFSVWNRERINTRDLGQGFDYEGVTK
ncbi:MAG: PorT family protein [Rikenellaceae bacterium]